jgi:hypothetical protein
VTLSARSTNQQQRLVLRDPLRGEHTPLSAFPQKGGHLTQEGDYEQTCHAHAQCDIGSDCNPDSVEVLEKTTRGDVGYNFNGSTV